MSETVAVLGLGVMGGRAAARLVPVCKAVRGYDPVPTVRETAARAGVKVSTTADEAVRGVDVVVLSLPGPAEVVQAASGPLAHLVPDTVVVDLSTIDPGSAREASALLQDLHGTYLDAPVLGRPERCGSWTLAVGGPPDALERVRGLLEASVATRVVHVGAVGSGSVVKLLNNLMFGAINAVTAEMFTISRLAGVDPQVLATVLADSGAAAVSPLFRELAVKIPSRDYTPTFAMALLEKDNRLALQLARQCRSPAFIAGCVNELNTLVTAQGWGREDTAALVKLYELLTPPGADAH